MINLPFKILSLVSIDFCQICIEHNFSSSEFIKPILHIFFCNINNCNSFFLLFFHIVPSCFFAANETPFDVYDKTDSNTHDHFYENTKMLYSPLPFIFSYSSLYL